MPRPSLHLIPLALLVAAGCSPQSAVLTEGTYWAFLSAGTSFSLDTEAVQPSDWDSGWNVDCLEYANEAERAARQLEPRVDVCREEPRTSDPLCRMDESRDAFPPGVDSTCEQWLSQSAWHVVTEDITPWRGEAVITGDNDFQVGFHHRLPGGEDLRFSFTVAHEFQPTACEVDENGDLQPVPLDGDWVANWTEDLRALGELDELPPAYEVLADYIDDPDARLFYLNARGYQFNPTQRADHTFWSIPYEWRAGFAAGKFSEELFHNRAPRWGQFELYDYLDLEGDAPANNPRADIWFCELEPGEDASQNACVQNRIDHANAVADAVAADFARVGLSTEGIDPNGGVGAGEPLYRPLIHENLWRIPDGLPAGFDGWVGLHYSYVVISGNVEPGEPVEGAFSILFDGDDSNSRFLIQGKFEVPRVKKDKWTAGNVRNEKHEENGTTRCSGVAIGF